MPAETQNLVRLDSAKQTLMRHFLGWQCRVRQFACREGDGRPTDGMRPSITIAGTEVGRITVVLNRLPQHSKTAEFRQMVRRTNEPLDRWEAAMRMFQGDYFQKPTTFTDELTALFSAGAAVPSTAAATGACVLDFAQFGQSYLLPCAARLLQPDDPLWQQTYWHNALFNPNLPGDATVLAMKPDWSLAEARPSPV